MQELSLMRAGRVEKDAARKEQARRNKSCLIKAGRQNGSKGRMGGIPIADRQTTGIGTSGRS